MPDRTPLYARRRPLQVPLRGRLQSALWSALAWRTLAVIFVSGIVALGVALPLHSLFGASPGWAVLAGLVVYVAASMGFSNLAVKDLLGRRFGDAYLDLTPAKTLTLPDPVDIPEGTLVIRVAPLSWHHPYKCRLEWNGITRYYGKARAESGVQIFDQEEELLVTSRPIKADFQWPKTGYAFHLHGETEARITITPQDSSTNRTRFDISFNQKRYRGVDFNDTLLAPVNMKLFRTPYQMYGIGLETDASVMPPEILAGLVYFMYWQYLESATSS